jgi:hypothetical protein
MRASPAITAKKSPGVNIAHGAKRMDFRDETCAFGRLNPNSSVAFSTADARAWWATEAERIGSNWQSLISLHFAICNRLQPASSSWRSS